MGLDKDEGGVFESAGVGGGGGRPNAAVVLGLGLG